MLCALCLTRVTVTLRHLSPAGLDVAEALLALDPARRPTADEVLKFPYFTTEEPKPEMPTMCALVPTCQALCGTGILTRATVSTRNRLADVKGEWHEYESKRERARKRHRDDA